MLSVLFSCAGRLGLEVKESVRYICCIILGEGEQKNASKSYLLILQVNKKSFWKMLVSILYKKLWQMLVWSLKIVHVQRLK